jgi:hypothetical protein
VPEYAKLKHHTDGLPITTTNFEKAYRSQFRGEKKQKKNNQTNV